MRSSRLRRSGTAVGGAAVLCLSAVGCGEDPVLDSSNRGSGSHTQSTTVENAYIVPAFLPGRCAIQDGAGGQMRFSVTNNRSTETERLLGLSTKAATVAPFGDAVDIPPKTAVAFGQPNVEAAGVDGVRHTVRLERLDRQLRPGMSADVTFHFKLSGDMTMPVPVEACPREGS
ncbi:hypothetical protein Mycch_2321 [Mycolicibacterium chubuense NBB4]|uniref:Copper chaperone PCu(A)C n=1 Tax=Mycolicibacterium chubuense (strain NBB4) TaxID=710421 RepID=I4BII9_MYCCN|nr:hypothetical protein [Mycolicibacterium chubuense]AFM17096.1 hypothetical protein Mycch_2321 [Mycolicibacterium chubuense NBB4]